MRVGRAGSLFICRFYGAPGTPGKEDKFNYYACDIAPSDPRPEVQSELALGRVGLLAPSPQSTTMLLPALATVVLAALALSPVHGGVGSIGDTTCPSASVNNIFDLEWDTRSSYASRVVEHRLVLGWTRGNRRREERH